VNKWSSKSFTAQLNNLVKLVGQPCSARWNLAAAPADLLARWNLAAAPADLLWEKHCSFAEKYRWSSAEKQKTYVSAKKRIHPSFKWEIPSHPVIEMGDSKTRSC
jgi:hypothetical protein